MRTVSIKAVRGERNWYVLGTPAFHCGYGIVGDGRVSAGPVTAGGVGVGREWVC